MLQNFVLALRFELSGIVEDVNSAWSDKATSNES
jgi:hypothetical protein